MSLRKSVSPYEYMNRRKKFNETTLLEKEGFYSNFNMEDIADRDCIQEEFEIEIKIWNKKLKWILWFVS